MVDTNKQRIHVGIDIITITPMWAFINSPYIATTYYNKPKNSPIYTTLLGISISTYMILRSCYSLESRCN